MAAPAAEVGDLDGAFKAVVLADKTALDAAVGKRTLVVGLGTKTASLVLGAAFAATYLLVGWLVLTRVLAPASLFVLATVPIALFAAIRTLRFHADRPRLLPANAAIVSTHLV